MVPIQLAASQNTLYLKENPSRLRIGYDDIDITKKRDSAECASRLYERYVQNY